MKQIFFSSSLQWGSNNNYLYHCPRRYQWGVEHSARHPFCQASLCGAEKEAIWVSGFKGAVPFTPEQTVCLNMCLSLGIFHLSLSLCLSPLKPGCELPASIFARDFTAAFILFKASPAWPFRPLVATSLMAPTYQLRIRNAPFESEKKDLKVQSKIHGIHLMRTLNVK